MASKGLGGLGKGLGALWEDNLTQNESNDSTLIKIYDIEPNADQPRKTFDEEGLKELSDSIAEHGIIQPIIVRLRPDGGYQIIAGERRWRAARMAGLKEVPVIIREINESQSMELALVENLQREDLNPLEQALGLRSLIDNYGMTQEEAAHKVGKSRPAVANTLRLLSLPKGVLEMLREEKISAGHAKALLALNNDENIIQMANEVVEKGMSVRDTERLVKVKLKNKAEKKTNSNKRDSYYDEAQLAFSQEIGRKCKIHGGTNDQGTLEIPFYGKEDLLNIMKLLLQ